MTGRSYGAGDYEGLLNLEAGRSYGAADYDGILYLEAGRSCGAGGYQYFRKMIGIITV